MSECPGCDQTDTLLAITTICFDIAGLEMYEIGVTAAVTPIMFYRSGLCGPFRRSPYAPTTGLMLYILCSPGHLTPHPERMRRDAGRAEHDHGAAEFAFHRLPRHGDQRKGQGGPRPAGRRQGAV